MTAFRADWGSRRWYPGHVLISIYVLTFVIRRGRERMPVGFITTPAIKVANSNPAHGEMYSIQHYVIQFISDLWQVSGIFGVFRFPRPIKRYSYNIAKSGVKDHNHNHVHCFILGIKGWEIQLNMCVLQLYYN